MPSNKKFGAIKPVASVKREVSPAASSGASRVRNRLKALSLEVMEIVNAPDDKETDSTQTDFWKDAAARDEARKKAGR